MNLIRRLISNPSELLISAIFLLFLALSFFQTTFVFNRDQQFSYQSIAFLEGKLHFTVAPDHYIDTAFVNDKYYWPLGPFPSLLLMPFNFITWKLFGLIFWQYYLHPILMMGLIILILKLGKHFRLSNETAIYLAFAYCFASVFSISAMNSWSWYFSHLVNNFFLFAAIFESQTKKRPLLMSVLFLSAILTRYSSAFLFPYFAYVLLETFNYKKLNTVKIKQFMVFLTPLVFGFIFLLYINYLRFGNPFDTGYGYVYIFVEPVKVAAASLGIYSLKNIPQNLIAYFLTFPKISLNPLSIKVIDPGVSFFVVSPIFLILYKFRAKTLEEKVALISVIISFISVLMWYWPGWLQVGPRYMLDFLPLVFLFVIKMFSERTLSLRWRFLIIYSAFVNLGLFWTVFLRG